MENIFKPHFERPHIGVFNGLPYAYEPFRPRVFIPFPVPALEREHPGQWWASVAQHFHNARTDARWANEYLGRAMGTRVQPLGEFLQYDDLRRAAYNFAARGGDHMEALYHRPDFSRADRVVDDLAHEIDARLEHATSWISNKENPNLGKVVKGHDLRKASRILGDVDTQITRVLDTDTYSDLQRVLHGMRRLSHK